MLFIINHFNRRINSFLSISASWVASIVHSVRIMSHRLPGYVPPCLLPRPLYNSPFTAPPRRDSSTTSSMCHQNHVGGSGIVPPRHKTTPTCHKEISERPVGLLTVRPRSNSAPHLKKRIKCVQIRQEQTPRRPFHFAPSSSMSSISC